MQGASLILTSYQDSLSRAMDVVANNVANINTTGFKRQEILFESLVTTPARNQEFVFAVERGTHRDASQGPIVTTGNALDLAIQGSGYFQVQAKAGTRYTRGGAFQLNKQGEIVTALGEKLLGDGDQPITLPDDAQDLRVSTDGVLTVKSGTGTALTQVGKLKLVKFADEQKLQPVGNSQYETKQTPQVDTESQLMQGAIEQSGVNSVSEMTRMIDVMRTYQQVVRMLDLEHQRQSNAISRLGKASAA